MKQFEQRQICVNQFEENKRLKDMVRQKEEEEQKQKPTGNDLLGQLFQQKRHQSYERREKNDKQIALMKNHF